MNFLNILPDDFVKKRAYTAFLWGISNRNGAKEDEKKVIKRWAINIRSAVGG